MVVIVLMGRKADRQRFVDKFTQLKQVDVEELRYLVSRSARTDHYKMLLTQYKNDNRVLLLPAVNNIYELALLRGMGAVVCHVYGHLDKLFKHVPILKQDYQLILKRSKKSPAHCFTIDEMLSDCVMRRRQKSVAA